MEDILNLYSKTYDPLYPVICFDERPCFLIEHRGFVIPMQPGKVKREHYEYKKNGSCCLFLAFDIHRGFRYVEVRQRRTAKDYAEFMENLFKVHYSNVDKICLIQDNLNTHNPGSFFKTMLPQQAFELAQNFEVHYTPKKGSWLNMAEIEFAALAKQCLNRRIPNMKMLSQEVYAWTILRNKKAIKINWKFNQVDARYKMQRHYKNIQKLM